jgi:hypothetical protein
MKSAQAIKIQSHKIQSHDCVSLKVGRNERGQIIGLPSEMDTCHVSRLLGPYRRSARILDYSILTPPGTEPLRL